MISGAEAGRIGQALASVASWTSEIIVVLNQEAADGTEQIAASFGAKVFREAWEGHVAQKNSALAKATQPWILGSGCGRSGFGGNCAMKFWLSRPRSQTAPPTVFRAALFILAGGFGMGTGIRIVAPGSGSGAKRGGRALIRTTAWAWTAPPQSCTTTCCIIPIRTSAVTC